MDIIVKKHWVYIGITGFIGVLLSFFIWNIYVSSKNPIIISLISTNPLLKNTQLNETLVTNVLKEYQYTYTKNSFFLQKKYATRYKKISILLVPEKQIRFAYKVNDKIYFGSGTIDTPTELIIKLYISDDYIHKWQEKNDLSYIQNAINRLFILELYTNSPSYKDFIIHAPGIPAVTNIGNQAPKKYIILK
jgi:hypothetical protein